MPMRGHVTSQHCWAQRHTTDAFCSTMLDLLLCVCSRICVSFVVLVFVAVQLALLQKAEEEDYNRPLLLCIAVCFESNK